MNVIVLCGKIIDPGLDFLRHPDCSDETVGLFAFITLMSFPKLPSLY